MVNSPEKHTNEDIDLKELFSILWRSKRFIILSLFVYVIIASFYLHNTVRKHTVKYILKPVVSESVQSNGMGLGGLANLAGIQLPTSSNIDFQIYKELLTSVEASARVIKNDQLIKNIFKSEWSEVQNNFLNPSQSNIQIFIGDVKRLLTGSDEIKYIPPNERRLANYIANKLQIKVVKENGFIEISSQTSDPDMILLLISEVTKASDMIMRQRYISFSTEPLLFYKKKISTARSREHREALAELIAKEEQKLLFASKSTFFTAEPYMKPVISLYPTSPRPMRVLLISLIFGLFISSMIVLTRNYIAKDNQ
ncbi:Wzz/FepE/Etk N-terminal domain-containing protein [Amylibacter sp.]|nr:Wzz/FepE/Etk N-terminal domain-containing protein [Amylibacter sp.]